MLLMLIKNYDYSLYVKHYSTFKHSCQLSSYKVANFVSLVGKSESIHDAFSTIMILQIVMGAINAIWICVLLYYFYDQKKADLNDCMLYLMVLKVVAIIATGFACFVVCLIVLSTANQIDQKEISYYVDKKCLVDYVQQEVDSFYNIYTSIHARLLAFVVLTMLQNIYEGGLYPGLKFYDKYLQAKH